MADNLFGTETPAITDATDSAEYALGTRFVPAVDGQATHGRWRFPDSAQPGGTQCRIGIYRVSDQVLLGQATFSASPTLGAWNEVAFSPAIDLAAGVTYVVAVYTPGRYVATTTYPWPKVSGDLTAGTSNGWLINALGGLQYPSTQSGNSASFFADLTFVPAGAAAPAPTGIAVPAALGSPTAAVNRSAGPTGLAVPAALGSPTVALDRTAAPAGLAVPVALGSPTVGRNGASPDGLAAALVVGTPATALPLSAAPAGIAVPVALGSPSPTEPGRAVTLRPNTGTTARPNTGITLRP